MFVPYQKSEIYKNRAMREPFAGPATLALIDKEEPSGWMTVSSIAQHLSYPKGSVINNMRRHGEKEKILTGPNGLPVIHYSIEAVARLKKLIERGAEPDFPGWSTMKKAAVLLDLSLPYTKTLLRRLELEYKMVATIAGPRKIYRTDDIIQLSEYREQLQEQARARQLEYMSAPEAWTKIGISRRKWQDLVARTPWLTRHMYMYRGKLCPYYEGYKVDYIARIYAKRRELTAQLAKYSLRNLPPPPTP